MEAGAFGARRALVTGGSSGIGRAVALALARSGAHVAIAARGAAGLEAVRDEMARAAVREGQRFAALPFDVADAAAAEAGVARAIEGLGGLDLVVNNAGLAHAARIEDTPLAAFRELLDVNYLGTVHVTRAALPHLVQQRSGHVANVSSLAGLLGIYGYTAYAPTKYAVTGFAEALRQELRPHGIGVSVCFPPDVDTPMLAAENRTKPAETRAIAGTAKVMTAEAVAQALLRGIARGDFWIFPGRESRFVALAFRLVPGIVRRVVDRDVDRARSGRRG